MATEYVTVEVWVKLNEAGDYDCGCDPEQAGERFEDSIGHEQDQGYRMVKLTVKVPLPKAIELTGEVAVEESEAGLKVT